MPYCMQYTFCSTLAKAVSYTEADVEKVSKRKLQNSDFEDAVFDVACMPTLSTNKIIIIMIIF